MLPTDVATLFAPSAEEDYRHADYAYFRAFVAGEQLPDGSRDKIPQNRVLPIPKAGKYPQVVVNYARTLLRKTISYTLSGPVRFNIVDADPDKAAAIEKLLNDYLDSAGAFGLDFSLALEASTIGDAAIKITAGADNAPVIASIDPAQLQVETDIHRPDRITQVAHTYNCTVGDLPGEWIPDGSDPTKPITVTEIWRDDQMAVLIDMTPHLQKENPYGWIPYVLLPNEPRPRSPWGMSDLIDLDPICRELNREVTNIGRIMEISGWPIIALEGVNDVDGIRVSPGALWEIPADAKAYVIDLLSQGGITMHNTYLDALYRMIHDISETPRTSFGDSGRALSGVALEVEIQPLVQKVRRKRSRLERHYVERNRRILDLLAKYGGMANVIGSARLTRPEWPAILPTDESEQIQNAILLTNQRKPLISRKTGMIRIGITDPDGEAAEIEAETAAEPDSQVTETPDKSNTRASEEDATNE